MNVTIHDVARQAGVSITTVSLVLNNRPCRVSADTRQRVVSAASALGFRSAAAAPMVAIMLPDIENAFFANLGQAFLTQAQEMGFHALTMVHEDKARYDLENLDALLDRGISGIVLVRSSRSTHAEGEMLLEKLRRRNIPVVVMDRRLDIPGVRSLLLDNRLGARLAVKYLLDQGHSRIGCITGPKEDGVSSERLKGYQDALNEAGIPYDPSLICTGSFRTEDGSRFLPYLLGKSITALFCFNDAVALGVYTGCRAYRLKIPENLSLIGFDDIPFCEILEVPLSTVAQPTRQMGQAAVRLLKAMMETPDRAESMVFSPILQIRGSTAPPPGAKKELPPV